MIRAMLASMMLVASAVAAWSADSFPSRPIRIVLPFAAGGGTDTVARILAQQLTQQMGVSVFVENRGGANGNLGAEAVARAEPDGYTIMYNTSFVATNPWLYPKLGYDPQHDFEPVLLIAKVPLVLVVHPSIPARDIREFIAYAKAKPGKLSYASSGIGGSTHLGNLLFQRAAGIEAVHVPYRGGGPALTDLMAGVIDFYMDTANTALPQIQAGYVRALVVSSRERLTDLPDVPTVAEVLQQPDFDIVSWQGVMVPAKTPPEIVTRLHQEFQRALQTPEIRQKLAAQATVPIGSTTAEYVAFLKKERELWRDVIASAKVRLE
jgi:tripartite-type tricarboxylate transporter receptor subunit TctC